MAALLGKIMDAIADISSGTQLDDIYPVGSIYMSVNSRSPANLFGGTWEQISDRFLVAAGSSYTAGRTGGSSTATVDISVSGGVASHTHSFSYQKASTVPVQRLGFLGLKDLDDYRGEPDTTYVEGQVVYLPYNTTGSSISVSSSSTSGTTGSSGSGSGGGSDSDTISTIPPYLAVYMWRRTA